MKTLTAVSLLATFLLSACATGITTSQALKKYGGPLSTALIVEDIASIVSNELAPKEPPELSSFSKDMRDENIKKTLTNQCTEIIKKHPDLNNRQIVNVEAKDTPIVYTAKDGSVYDIICVGKIYFKENKRAVALKAKKRSDTLVVVFYLTDSIIEITPEPKE